MINKNETFFEKLFIFEMANNHSGDINHGIKIIKEMKKISDKYGFKFAFKLQYRELDSFIHPDYKTRQDIKYIKRFSDTKLSAEDFEILKNEIDNAGFVSICTPFDEKSVDLIEKHNYDVIKIASCSFTDWPLLEKIALTDKPIIASTASASFEEIDQVVSFFDHRNKDLCVMHCVGSYPTKKEDLHLSQIDLLKKRYPNITIGFSTHEDPDNTDSIKIAVAKGAKVFERHVAVETDVIKKNAYSSNPSQIDAWLNAAKDAYSICGEEASRYPISEKEKEDLRGLKRGVFALKKIRKGEKINSENSFFAIPNSVNQVLANDFSKYTEYIAGKDLNVNEAIMYDCVNAKNLREQILNIIKQLKEIIVKSNIVLPNRLDLELSHHYGIEKYSEYGAAILNCINREYCKKLIILLPGQNHPDHHHVKKEETFHVLYGDMNVNLSGKDKSLQAGDMLTVEREMKHRFSSHGGCVFEEVSTTHYKNDSFYEDKKVINNKERKTEMTFWSDWLYKELN